MGDKTRLNIGFAITNGRIKLRQVQILLSTLDRQDVI